MDESAEWRRRFDLEFDKAAKCYTELDQVCASFFSQNFISICFIEIAKLTNFRNIV